MLDAMRRGASGWLAKGLFGILVVAFAIWGIPHNFLSWSDNFLAKVGYVEISPEEFQDAYRNQLERLGQLGRRLTPEQGRQFGLDVRALYGLIDTAAVDNHARQLNLGVSDETVASQIAREPSFKSPDGKFDKEAFKSFLNQIRMSEGQFIAQRRKDEVREQLTGAIVGAVTVPDSMVDSLHAWREEKRKIRYLTIPEGAVTVPEADDAKLKETYEQSKRQFMVPEVRKLAVLALDLATVKARVSISDDEVKGYFDKNRASLDIPERRRIHQIVFKDKAAADAGKKAVDAGKPFMVLALEAEGPAGRLPGLVARADLGDLKLAETAFSLPKDKVSDVLQTSAGPMLIMVGEVVPGKERTFDEVKDEIRERLTAQKVNDELNSLHDAIDNNRAARKPLKEIAETLKLKYAEASTERNNRTSDGKVAFELPDAQEIVEQGFQGAVGVEAEPTETKDGGLVWIDVLDVTPEKEKPFEAVTEDIKAVYLDSTRRKLLSDLAAKVVDRINAGETFAALAKEVAGKVEVSDAITRTTTPQGLSPSAVQLAFATPANKASSAESPDRKSRTIFRVVEVIKAEPATKEESDKLRGELARQMQNDTLQAYAAALRDQLGVRINEPALRRVSGGERQ